MPVIAITKGYNASLTGALPLTYLKSNAGDTEIAVIDVVEEISVASGSNILSHNAAQKTISWGNGNFLTEGFRPADDIEITIYDAAGGVVSQVNRTISAVDATFIVYSGAAITWYDQTAGQTIEILIDSKGGTVKRKGLLLDINHIPNSSSGTEFSLIDGEVTRFSFDLTGTVFNQIVPGVQVGLKSGQFVSFAQVQDKTNYTTSPNRRSYRITIATVQSGVYDSSYFNFSNCLKLYIKQNWQRDVGDPNNMLQYSIGDQAETGWFDEAFNTGVINSALVQGIPILDYFAPTSGQFSVDYAPGQFFFGAAYVPTDEAYYKQQPYNQSQLSMIAPTQGNNIYPLTFSTAFPNPSGGAFTFVISNPQTVGTITTFDYTFTPNLQFATFIESRDEGDRLFRLWVRAGNVNWLLFNDQLTREPQPGTPLNVVVSNFQDHSENYTDTNVTQGGFQGNVEDDLSFIGKFIVPFGTVIDSVTASLEAYNTATNESFILQSATFDFGSVPLVFGAYPISQQQTIFNFLQDTNVKKVAELVRDSSVDNATDYGFRIHFPMVYKWEYWLPQTNANAEFYPNEQTQDYVPYGTTANWELRFKLASLEQGVEHAYEETIIIKDYDSDQYIDQDITLIRDLDNTQVSVVIEGEIMRVVATHTLNKPLENWVIPSVWGMITVEPKEAGPRWDCSTVVPFDNNPLNPLTPLSGSFCDLTFPSGNVARMECFFNSNKINLEKGVKFTTKIKGCKYQITKNMKLLTDNQVKLTTDGLPKIIS